MRGKSKMETGDAIVAARRETALRNPPEAMNARRLLALLMSITIALGIVVVRYVTISDIDADEVEHVHVTWALSQGIVPYRGIHQAHTPFLWILCEPFVKRLPESIATFVALRAGCVLAFVGIFVVGLLVLREVYGRLRWVHAMVLLPLMLSCLPDLESYRFRPDPWMAFCTACAVLAAVRLRRAPLRYAFLCGTALGLAASFSPKMAPLCLLVPVLCLVECRYQRSWRPLGLVIPNALGFAAGILPMFCWLSFHGLLGAFLSSNSHSLGLFVADAGRAMEDTQVLLALAVFGGFQAIRMQLDTPRAAWAPVHGLLAAAVLAWFIPMIEPNRLTYNLQAFLMPAAVLGTLLVAHLLELEQWPWRLRLAMVASVFVFACAKPMLNGIDVTTKGATIPMSDMQTLIELRASRDSTCVGFAPWHPAFCRDATELYAGWDLWILMLPGISQERAQVCRDMWSEAVSEMERNQPDLIIDTPMWKEAHVKRAISDEEFRRFKQLTRSRYHPIPVGKMVAFVRNDLVTRNANDASK